MKATKFFAHIFYFLMAVLLIASLVSCDRPSPKTLQPFADVDFVNGEVGRVQTAIPLRSLNTAEFDRVKNFLQKLELRRVDANENGVRNEVRPGFQLYDAQGVTYFICCGIERSTSIMYYTRHIKDGTRVNIECDKYYIDEADMQAFEAMCSEMLEAQPQTLQPFAEAEIIGVEWYQGSSMHSPAEGEDLEALKVLLKELVIEVVMPPLDEYDGFSRYYVTLAEGRIVWIIEAGYEDEIWIDNVFYACKTPALIEKLGEVGQIKYQESKAS